MIPEDIGHNSSVGVLGGEPFLSHLHSRYTTPFQGSLWLQWLLLHPQRRWHVLERQLFFLRFTQSSRAPQLTGFGDGYSIYHLAKELRDGTLDVNNVDRIRVVKWEDKYCSLDNRRLWAFKKANLKSVPVQLHVPNKWFLRRIKKVGDGWIAIQVRGGEHWQCN
jgi:hypothetical protein